MSGQPFIDYLDSQYYWRYLQWKYLERYAGRIGRDVGGGVGWGDIGRREQCC